MATKKSSATRKKTGKSNHTSHGDRQLYAVIWFAVAVLLGCMVFIPGENIWNVLHKFVFGICGVTAYVYPFLLALVAILSSGEHGAEKISTKIWQVLLLTVLASALVDAFALYNRFAGQAGKHLQYAYKYGSYKNGGFLGALISHPLCFAFSKVCAIIVLFVLVFVLLMSMTGTTLSALFFWRKDPAVDNEKKINEREARVTRPEETAKNRGNLRIIKNFDADQPVDDSVVKKHETPEEKKQKVLDAYADEEVPPKKTKRGTKHTADTADGAEDAAILDTALVAAKKEAAEEEPFNAAAETAEMSQKIGSGIKLSEDAGYRFPPLSLLKAANYRSGDMNSVEHMNQTGERLVETLRSFGVETRIVDISCGPTVTRYELQPCAGVKISKITNLADDIALNLATAGVRIEAPIPNKAAVGIEVPNKAGATVGVREILESTPFTSAKSKLTIALGKDIAGNAVVGDIAKMPHGLIAGATGSGKSVCINSIIMSILYKASPDEVKLLMIDPKVVELGVYNGIPHLLVPVVTDPRKAAGALGWAVSEMEKRYAMFADRGVRDLAGYNKLIDTLKEDEPELEKLPQIVIIIDELADLMMTAPGEVEDSISRIAAKARAAGMHLLIATQRPSVDVVTGVIKANIPSRIAFAVSSQIDSRTILDTGGAEKLLGRGDMLFNPVGCAKPNRIQGCFVSDEEVESVVEFIKHGGDADYSTTIMDEIEKHAVLDKKQKNAAASEDGEDDADPVLDEAMRIVVETGQASTSMLQRKLKLGYSRAGRVIDQLEQRGVVGPFEGSKPRKVLMTEAQLLEYEAGNE